MKKIILCMSLVSVVSMYGSESKKKIDINNLDQLRKETREAQREWNRTHTHGSDFVEKLEQKKNRMHSEHSTAGDTKSLNH